MLTQVDRIGGGSVTFSHDENGNVTQGDGEQIDYNAFNKPTLIQDFGHTLSTRFEYGADGMRYKQVTVTGATIYYIDKLMEIETSGSSIDYRHYLGDVAILTKTGSLNDPDPGIQYTFRDRLGSIAAIADDTGYNSEQRGYDAYGKPRAGNWADMNPPVLNSSVTNRGFTDHEHLDDWQLIHMNGRSYDYNLGQFMSIDPIIQSPGNSQSINGYAYIMNNPLSGMDPSGYSAVEFECQSKPETCRAVMEAEFGQPEGSIGQALGMPSVRASMLAGFNGASVTRVMDYSKARVSVNEYPSSSDGSGSNMTEFGSSSNAPAEASANSEAPAGVMPNDVYEDYMGYDYRAYMQELAETGRVTAEIAEGLLGAVNPADPINLLGGVGIKVAASSIGVLLKTGKLASRTMKALREGEKVSTGSLRGQAVRIWEAQTGKRASASGLVVHHRIPLEHSGLFPDAYPNRLTNLVGVSAETHDKINKDWGRFKLIQKLEGHPITAESVAAYAEKLDERYASELRPLVNEVTK